MIQAVHKVSLLLLSDHFLQRQEVWISQQPYYMSVTEEKNQDEECSTSDIVEYSSSYVLETSSATVSINLQVSMNYETATAIFPYFMNIA